LVQAVVYTGMGLPPVVAELAVDLLLSHGGATTPWRLRSEWCCSAWLLLNCGFPFFNLKLINPGLIMFRFDLSRDKRYNIHIKKILFWRDDDHTRAASIL
jgi:hypothetical protein